MKSSEIWQKPYKQAKADKTDPGINLKFDLEQSFMWRTSNKTKELLDQKYLFPSNNSLTDIVFLTCLNCQVANKMHHIDKLYVPLYYLEFWK